MTGAGVMIEVEASACGSATGLTCGAGLAAPGKLRQQVGKYVRPWITHCGRSRAGRDSAGGGQQLGQQIRDHEDFAQKGLDEPHRAHGG